MDCALGQEAWGRSDCFRGGRAVGGIGGGSLGAAGRLFFEQRTGFFAGAGLGVGWVLVVHRLFTEIVDNRSKGMEMKAQRVAESAADISPCAEKVALHGACFVANLRFVGKFYREGRVHSPCECALLSAIESAHSRLTASPAMHGLTPLALQCSEASIRATNPALGPDLRRQAVTEFRAAARRVADGIRRIGADRGTPGKVCLGIRNT